MLQLFYLTVFLFAQSSSDPSCPWLTEGSAAKVLGGPVRVVLSSNSPNQGTCTFVNKEHPQDQLKVFVGAGDVPSCPAGSAHVIGIGNEASRCPGMISGRVRTVNLAVTLSGKRNEDAIEQIAEQVAGNLF